MTDIRLRPRFDRTLMCGKEEALQMLRQAVEDPGVWGRGSVFRNSCVLKVPASEVRFWSPQLQVSVEATGESESMIHGIYGPRPSVWSVFVALYAAIGFLGTMGVIYGFSQWSIGDPATALWSGPVAVAAAVLVWIAGRYGRSRGMDQMKQLRGVLHTTLGSHLVVE